MTREIVCCYSLTQRYTLKHLAERYALSSAHRLNVYTGLKTIAQAAILARFRVQRIVSAGARSTVHEDAMGIFESSDDG